MSKDLEKPPEQPLSVREKMKLKALETVIAQDFTAFVRVGQALAEINEARLYRITKDKRERTFEQYCREVCDLSSNYAYRYITAAQTYDNVANWQHSGGDDEVIELTPANEAQVRPLTKVRPDQQAIVWQTAVKSAKNGKPTAAHVKRTVDDFLGAQVGAAVEKVKRQQRDRKDRLSPEFMAAYDALLEVVKVEAKAGWPGTDKDTAVSYIQSIVDAIKG